MLYLGKNKDGEEYTHNNNTVLHKIPLGELGQG